MRGDTSCGMGDKHTARDGAQTNAAIRNLAFYSALLWAIPAVLFALTYVVGECRIGKGAEVFTYPPTIIQSLPSSTLSSLRFD